jgi:hypothetical protein
VDELFAGCKKILEKKKITFLDIRVPGAFEIPFAIKKYWEKNVFPKQTMYPDFQTFWDMCVKEGAFEIPMADPVSANSSIDVSAATSSIMASAGKSRPSPVFRSTVAIMLSSVSWSSGSE